MKRKIVFLFILSVLGLFHNPIKANPTGSKNVKELTEQTFNAAIEKGVVIVDFWATWCRPCLMQAPIFEEAAKEMQGKVVFAKLDVDKAKKISSTYRISGIPCLIIFKDGKEVGRLVGMQNKENIIAALKQAVDKK